MVELTVNLWDGVNEVVLDKPEIQGFMSVFKVAIYRSWVTKVEGSSHPWKPTPNNARQYQAGL